MDRDKSAIDRQNILNNGFAMPKIREKLDIAAIPFEGEEWLTSQQVIQYFDISRATLARYLDKYGNELKSNGYKVLTGEQLRRFQSGCLTNETTKVTVLGVFNVRAFLNLAMLLAESEQARELRQLMLNITTNSILERAGGSTKYINQREDGFLETWFWNEQYTKKLHDALKKYVEGGREKYAYFTDLIYKCIFRESSREYRTILELNKQDKTRNTMYKDVLMSIACLENSIAANIVNEAKHTLKRKLTRRETKNIIQDSAKSPALEPQVEQARKTMASLDHALRAKRHKSLVDYISPVDQAAYERFLGKKSRELSARIQENLDVFKRLKDK